MIKTNQSNLSASCTCLQMLAPSLSVDPLHLPIFCEVAEIYVPAEIKELVKNDNFSVQNNFTAHCSKIKSYFHICCVNMAFVEKIKTDIVFLVKNKIMNCLWTITGILATASCLLWRSRLSKLSSSSISFLWSCQMTQKHYQSLKIEEHLFSPYNVNTLSSMQVVRIQIHHQILSNNIKRNECHQ